MNARIPFFAAIAAIIAAGWAAGAAETPLKVHMISGSKEYRSHESLARLREYLEKERIATCTISAGEDGGNTLPGIEAIDQADVLVVFCRRMKLPDDQLERIKKWCAAGKPVIGIRTASHAFQTWLEFDRQVLGGDYRGHGGSEQWKIAVEEKNSAHPVLAGVRPWERRGTIYNNPSPASDIVVLLTVAGAKGSQPLAWARVYDAKNNGRAFYTSAGYPEDFAEESFLRMLANAVLWTAGRNVPPAR